MIKRVSFLLVLLLLVSIAVQANTKPVQYVVHGRPEQVAIYREVFDRFTAETGIPVEIIHVAGGQKGKWEKVLVNVAGGVSPDVVGGVSTEFGEFAMTGLLLPLDEFMERDGVDMESLVPPFVEALQYNGKQYLLPYGGTIVAMFYNQDHFQQAGVAPPPTEWNTPEWTYEAFVDTARKLTITDDSGRVSRYGISGRYWDTWISLPYPWGGRWISDDLKTFMGDQPEAIAALQSLQDLIYRERVMPNGSAVNNFVAQTGSIGGFGTWYLQTLAQSDVNWSFMPWFRVKETTQAAMNPIGYGILSTSDNKENAWELVKYLTWNEDANFSYAVGAGAFPSLKQNLPLWREHWEEIAGPDINADVAINQAVLHGAIIQIRKSPAFWRIDEIMNAAATHVVYNRKPADLAVSEVAAQIQALIDESEGLSAAYR